MKSVDDSDGMRKWMATIHASMASSSQLQGDSFELVPDAAVLEGLIEQFRVVAFAKFVVAQTNHAAREDKLKDAIVRMLENLVVQVHAALRVAEPALNVVQANARANYVVSELVDHIPNICALLQADATAALEGDPAAQSLSEVILCYPGLQALIAHRFAHELHLAGAPLVPRMLAEISHRKTGIDIHPGASIGAGFFIDHGTGVVIGETTVIGQRCKIYQGVTLGAKSFERDESGRLKKNYRRHPTLEDHVTVYAGATILGGDTVIGRGCVIGGGVFLTASVPAEHFVHAPRAEITLRSKGDTL